MNNHNKQVKSVEGKSNSELWTLAGILSQETGNHLEHVL